MTEPHAAEGFLPSAPLGPSPEEWGSLLRAAVKGVRPDGRSASPPRVIDTDRVVHLLEKAGGDLEALEIRWKTVAQGREGDDPWRDLWYSLYSNPDPRKAFVIFDSLARSVRGNPEAAMDLMEMALHCPLWRVRAIHQYPWIFENKKDYSRWSGAGYVLAKEPIDRLGETPEAIFYTLEALQAAGLQDPAPIQGVTVLMRAAFLRAESSFSGFVAHFKPLINAQDDSRRTALHHAVNAVSSLKLSQLLDAGADARLRDDAGETPLASFMRISSPKAVDGVRVLLESGQYTSEDIEDALADCPPTMGRAFVHAWRARTVIAEASRPGAMGAPRPL